MLPSDSQTPLPQADAPPAATLSPLERRFLAHFAASNFSIHCLFDSSLFTAEQVAALLDSPSLQTRLNFLVTISNSGTTLAANEQRLFSLKQLRALSEKADLAGDPKETRLATTALARATVVRAVKFPPPSKNPTNPPPRPPDANPPERKPDRVQPSQPDSSPPPPDTDPPATATMRNDSPPSDPDPAPTPSAKPEPPAPPAPVTDSSTTDPTSRPDPIDPRPPPTASSAHPPRRTTSALLFSTAPPPPRLTPSPYTTPDDVALAIVQAIARPDDPKSGGFPTLVSHLDDNPTINGEPIPTNIADLTRCADRSASAPTEMPPTATTDLAEASGTTNPVSPPAHFATLPPLHPPRRTTSAPVPSALVTRHSSLVTSFFSSLRRTTHITPDHHDPLPGDTRPVPRGRNHMPPREQSTAAVRLDLTLRPPDAHDPPDPLMNSTTLRLLLTFTRRPDSRAPNSFLLTSITTDSNYS